jgi:hypothetical protein
MQKSRADKLLCHGIQFVYITTVSIQFVYITTVSIQSVYVTTVSIQFVYITTVTIQFVYITTVTTQFVYITTVSHVLYDCDSWSFTLRDKNGLRVLEQRVLITTFWSKRDR